MNNITYSFGTDQLLQVLSLSKNATAVYTTENIIIQTANDAMLAFWGKDRSIIGKPLEEGVPELKGQPFTKMLQKVLKTGITDSGVSIPAETFINGKLQTRYYDYEYRAIKNEAGETYCILHTADDVTERVLGLAALNKAKAQQEALEREQILNEELATANEELNAINEELQDSQQNLALLNAELEERVKIRTKALTESEAKMRYMLTDAPIAIAVFTGKNLIIESANKKVLEVYGKTAEIIGKPLQEAIPELAGQDFLPILEDVFKTGNPFYGNEIKAMLEQNGVIEEVYSNFVYQPLKNSYGQTTSIMLVANVITEQVLARKRVERAEEMLRFSIEAANVGTWFLDLKTRAFLPSLRMNEMYGFYPDEIVSYDAIINQIPAEHRKMIEIAIDKAITEGSSYQVEHPVIDFHNQQLRWVRASGKLNSDDHGDPVYFSGIVIDITEQKQDEQRKNDFIGMVSHELKTPLTSLSAYIQMLHAKAGKTEDTATTNALNKANKQVKKMGNMINGFLDVSRLESGKISLNKQTFNLDELVAATIEETKLMQPGHNLIFFPCDPTRINADYDKIGNVISNLLSNATKYSAKGSTITIKCDVIDNEAHISVQDEGIGIKAQDMEKLFDRYYRVESNHTISGFGIGLYLSAEIIKRHNGRIWVESDIEKGSIFNFTVPTI